MMTMFWLQMWCLLLQPVIWNPKIKVCIVIIHNTLVWVTICMLSWVIIINASSVGNILFFAMIQFQHATMLHKYKLTLKIPHNDFISSALSTDSSSSSRSLVSLCLTLVSSSFILKFAAVDISMWAALSDWRWDTLFFNCWFNSFSRSSLVFRSAIWWPCAASSALRFAGSICSSSRLVSGDAPTPSDVWLASSTKPWFMSNAKISICKYRLITFNWN